MLEEEATVGTGERLPTLTGSGVGEQYGGVHDCRAIHRDHHTLHRGTGNALRRECHRPGSRDSQPEEPASAGVHPSPIA